MLNSNEPPGRVRDLPVGRPRQPKLGQIVMYRTAEPVLKEGGDSRASDDFDAPDKWLRGNHGEVNRSVGEIWRPAIVTRVFKGLTPPLVNLRVIADGPSESDSWRTSVFHVSKTTDDPAQRVWAYADDEIVDHWT